MIIYNVTLKVDNSIAENWTSWMKNVHIPEVMDTGCFHKFQFVRLLDVDDSEGPTFAVQYFALSRDDYDKYIAEYSKKLRQRSLDEWGNKFIGFRSIMQVLD